MSEMSLKISGKRFDFFNQFNLSLEFNSFASTFSFQGLIKNEEQKQLFKPLSYADIQVLFRDEVLLTGIVLNISTSIENQLNLGGISGYSKTGVLEDCEVPLTVYPIQFDNLSLKQITEKIIKPFVIKLVVDPVVLQKSNKKYTKTDAKADQKIKAADMKIPRRESVISYSDFQSTFEFIIGNNFRSLRNRQRRQQQRKFIRRILRSEKILR